MTFHLEAVKKLLPKGQRTLITQEYLDKMEESIGNPVIAEQFKENFITYLSVLQTGKYKMDDYINAVKYISHKLLGKSNIDAYAATFPGRFQRLKDEGQTQIDAFCSMYNSNKLVRAIYEQTMVPTHVLNAPLHQEALNTLAKMIHELPNGLIRVKACEVILNATKPPEVIKNEFTIGVEQQETIADLRAVVDTLADTFRVSLEKGHKSLRDVADANIVNAEYEVVDEEDV